MAFGANKGTWLFGANSIVANNQATLSTGSAVVAKGDLIVVVIGEVVANTSSGASDTLGNTYTAITAGTLVGATVSGRAFYTIVTNAGTNTNINVQATASSNNVAIVAASYEGSFSAIDKQPANNNNTDNASPFTCPATGTLAQQLEVIVAWMVDNTANVKTATSPNIKDNQQSQVTVSSVLGHQVVNVTTTVSPAYTGTNPTASIQGTASFRAADLPENTFYISLPNQGFVYPVQARTWTESLLPLPLGDVVQVQAPFNQQDWPVPKAYDYPVQARTWTESLLPLPLAGVVAPSTPTDVLRAPYFSPPRAPPLLIYEIPRNLLASTLAAPAAPAETATVRAPYFSPPRQPLPLRYDIASNITVRLPAAFPFNQFSWPLTSAPSYHISLRSWAGVQQPPAPVGAALPIGTISTVLPVAYQFSVQLRTWTVSPRPVEIVVAAPFNQFSWPIPRGYEFSVNLRSWTTSPRPAEIVVVVDTSVPRAPHFSPPRKLDPLIPGVLVNPLTLRAAMVQIPFSQTDWPLTRALQQAGRTWVWNYNLNLIGKDALPVGKDILDLPPQPPLSAIQLRTWINTAALALVTVPAKLPFNQYDWPINIGPRQPTPIFTASYNKNLIAQDQLPKGEIVSDLPPRGYQQPALSYTASYNQNLIGKDALPTGAEITALPPQPALSAIQLRTWIQTVNLQLITVIPPSPFNQTDWPIRLPPTPQARTFVGSYNLNLIGKDALPVGEIRTDVPAPQRLAAVTWINAVNLALIAVQALPAGEINTALPPQQQLAAQTWINAVNLVLAAPAVAPFNQTAWPLNTGPRQPDRSYGYVFPKVLVGQDKLPFRQQDWPLYRPFLQPAFSYTAFYNRNLIGKDRLPIRQQYWPLTRDIREFRSWINKTDPNLFIPGPAPPPPRSPSHRDVSLAMEATRFGEAEQIRPEAPQSRRPTAPRSTRSNIQDPGIRR